ncbi:response regulator [Butyrivibrio sp. AE2032]|uniref:response regulator n=1 Tax=Butyrivibrio sp. AE2032 TaxID=1458463 RepID=UPI0005564722|nr:response regulator [Butyrivibrio sp. AE2032]
MKRVLVVDDSRTSRRVLKDILDKAGYEVTGEAINGKEAVELYDRLLPDVVTMDITMPEMDGIEALKQIRKAHPDAVIIMVTAAGQKEKMMEAVKLGAAEFVAKPFVEETVLEALEHVAAEQAKD